MMLMRKIILCFLFCLSVVAAAAQDKGGTPEKGAFSPKEFEANLEKYVIKEAGITAKEAEKFLPVYREMRQKQIDIMDAERKTQAKKPATEKECEATIKAHDNAEIQLKKIVQTYHNKMLEIIPASKIMKVTRAENQFHRDSFRQMHDKRQPPRPRK